MAQTPLMLRASSDLSPYVPAKTSLRPTRVQWKPCVYAATCVLAHTLPPPDDKDARHIDWRIYIHQHRCSTPVLDVGRGEQVVQ